MKVASPREPHGIPKSSTAQRRAAKGFYICFAPLIFLVLLRAILSLNVLWAALPLPEPIALLFSVGAIAAAMWASWWVVRQGWASLVSQFK